MTRPAHQHEHWLDLLSHSQRSGSFNSTLKHARVMVILLWVHKKAGRHEKIEQKKKKLREDPHFPRRNPVEIVPPTLACSDAHTLFERPSPFFRWFFSRIIRSQTTTWRRSFSKHPPSFSCYGSWNRNERGHSTTRKTPIFVSVY